MFFGFSMLSNTRMCTRRVARVHCIFGGVSLSLSPFDDDDDDDA